MISRSADGFGIFDVFCDFCSAHKIFDTNDDWIEMIEQAKDIGWRFFKEDGEWKSKCPACMEQFIEDLKG